jgi:hypothetical protein
MYVLSLSLLAPQHSIDWSIDATPMPEVPYLGAFGVISKRPTVHTAASEPMPLET